MFRFPSTYFSRPEPEPSPLDFGYSRPSSRQYSYQDFDSFRRSQEIERLIREQQVRYQREQEELRRQRELEAEEEMKRLWISEMRRREQEEAKREWIAEMQRREMEAAREAKRRYVEQEERRKRARFEDEALRLLAQEKRRVEKEEEAEARRNEREEGVEGIFRLLGFGPSFDAPSPAAPRQSKPAPPPKKTKPQPTAVSVEKQAETVPAQASDVPSPPHSPIPDLIPTATSVHLAKIASKLTTLASTVLPSPSTLHLTSPTLGFHQSNIAYLTQKEQLEKLLLELDGIDSEGKEEVRKERKRLVLRAEEALQELEGKVKAEWEQRNRDNNDEQVPAPADVEAPVTEEKMEVDSLPVEAEVTATEEKVEVDSKAVEKELEDNVVIAPTLEEVQTESTPIEFVEETSSILDASSKANEEVEPTALPTSSSAEVEGYEIPVLSNSVPADLAVEQSGDVEMTNADSKETEAQRGLDDYADSSVSHGDDIATDDRMSAGVVIEPESVRTQSQEREKEDDDEVLSDLSSEDEASGKEDGEYYVVA